MIFTSKSSESLPPFAQMKLLSHTFLSFPTQTFPSEIVTYRPPQAVRNTSIQKITSCENTFAALSTNGELFTFTLPTTGAVKPQRVWALRKQFSAVTVRLFSGFPISYD